MNVQCLDVKRFKFGGRFIFSTSHLIIKVSKEKTHQIQSGFGMEFLFFL